MKALIVFLLQSLVLTFLCKMVICMIVPKPIRYIIHKTCYSLFSIIKTSFSRLNDNLRYNDDDTLEFDNSNVIEFSDKAK